MECATCSRGPPSSKLPFHCVSCARNSIYELRIDSAIALLEKEALSRKTNRLAPTIASDADALQRLSNRTTTRSDIDHATARVADCHERTCEIKTHSELLRREIENGKAEISRLRASLAQRRSDHAASTHQLASRRAATLESVQKAIKRTNRKAGQQHQKMAESRAFLCREAANLYGLKQRRKRKDGIVKEDYTIGGVAIFDLRELNNCPAPQISTCLTQLSHLLVLTSHYLSVQLPAEITLPHRDYPLPTIFPPSSSYTPQSTSIPFPGTTPSHSLSSSPTASRHNVDSSTALPFSRPRPLCLDRSLPVLAKDDPVAYSLFIEGVSLLAWNIAWLCRTQGLNVASTLWEEVCPFGRNLHQLLCATPPPSPIPAINHLDATPPPPPGQHSRLGHFSHGTAFAFLGQGEGMELMRAWKIRSATQVADKVKAALLGEMAGAEWELLEEREWDGGGGLGGEDEARGKEDEGAVLVGGRKKGTSGNDGSRQDGSAGAGQVNGPADGKSSGTSGWTKLKPR